MVEWQTRRLQVPMVAIPCRFKSCYPHHNFVEVWLSLVALSPTAAYGGLREDEKAQRSKFCDIRSRNFGHRKCKLRAALMHTLSVRTTYHKTKYFEVWLSLVERCVRDAEAVGSNPVTSTIKLTSVWLRGRQNA